MDPVLSSPAETELPQPGGTLEELDKSITAAGPCKRNAVGISLSMRAKYSTTAMVDAPLMCTLPCAAAVLENSPRLCQIAPRELLNWKGTLPLLHT